MKGTDKIEKDVRNGLFQSRFLFARLLFRTNTSPPEAAGNSSPFASLLRTHNYRQCSSNNKQATQSASNHLRSDARYGSQSLLHVRREYYVHTVSIPR